MDPTPLPLPSPPQTPLQSPPLHQDDADEDDQSVKQLQECSSIYLSLQDCLVNTDRNWKSCQMEVQALKACTEERMRRIRSEKDADDDKKLRPGVGSENE